MPEVRVDALTGLRVLVDADHAEAHEPLFTALPDGHAEERVVGGPAAWRDRMRQHAGAACLHLRATGIDEARLWALDFVPAAIARERERARAYATQTMGSTLLADLVQEEVRRRERLVAYDDTAVVFAPYAPRVPRQLLLAPRSPAPRWEQDDGTGDALLAATLERLGPGHEAWVRTAPEGADHYCWRIDLVPTAHFVDPLADATGVPSCPLAPEAFAAQLRGVIAIAATIAAAVAAGIAAHRHRPEPAARLSRRILTVMLYGLYPPVVFLNLARLSFDADVLGGIVLAWVAVAAAGCCAYLVATRAMRLSRPRTGTLINTTLHPNTGYLGLPICAATLGAGSLDRAVAYDTLVAVPTLLLGVFGVGAAFGTTGDDGLGARVRRFLTRNPPLWAAAAGLAAPAALAPPALVDASHVLVYGLLPLGFFAVGVTLASESVRPSLPLGAALVLRLLVAPALLIAITAPFVALPDPYLLVAAMPTGVNGLVVAHAYGLDVGLQASAAAYGTVIVVVAATLVTLAT